MSGERNSKMTDQRVEAILNALRTGCTRRAAAAVGGISAPTFYSWIDRDVTFHASVERAEGEAEATFTGIVAQAAITSWQAAAWWLERRKFTDFARHDKVDMSVDVKREAERIATAHGLSVADVLAEADLVLAESR